MSKAKSSAIILCGIESIVSIFVRNVFGFVFTDNAFRRLTKIDSICYFPVKLTFSLLRCYDNTQTFLLSFYRLILISERKKQIPALPETTYEN